MSTRTSSATTTNGTIALPTSSSSNGSSGSGGSGSSSRPVRVWLDTNQLYAASNSSSIQQPQTQQFANFEATPSEVLNGTVIDVNGHVVVYTVKNGLIRVLHRHSTLRTLLRAHHQQTVTDIRFFQDGDVLATVASASSVSSSAANPNSSVVIWRIYEGAADIVSDKLLEISTPHMHITRVIWHPFNPNQFWMIHQNKTITSNHAANVGSVAVLGPTVATLVETTSISTQPAHAPEESHAVCEFASHHVIRHGAIQLSSGGSTGTSNLTDLAWSGRDTRHVMTTHDSGEVILWDLQQINTPSSSVGTAAPYTVTPTRLATIPNASERGPITRCLFLPHENMSSSHGAASASSNNETAACLTTCFATASDNNSIITLWSPFVASSSSSSNNSAAAAPLPTKVQVLGLEQQQQQPASTSYLLDVMFGPTPPDASPPSCFLLLADRSSGKILALHVRAAWGGSISAGQQQQQSQHRSVLLEGCDYVVPFTTRYPTYAWSVVVIPSTDIAEEALTEQGSLIFDMKLFAYQSRLVQCLTLTSYMCLPPSSTTTSTSSINNDVVRVEPLSSGGGGSSNISEIDESDIVAATKSLTLEQYDEDYDVDDDQDDDQDDDDDVYADADGAPTSTTPIQPSPPPPPPPALATGMGNPFANWLGAIAGTSVTAAAAAPTPSPPPTGLGGLLPPPPPTPTMSTSLAAPPASALPPPIGTLPGLAVGGANALQGGFLSPSDFVFVPPAAAASPSPAAAVVPPSSKKAENKKEKRSKKSSAVAAPPPPAPPGGVQLLKRGAVEIKNTMAPPSAPPAAAAAVAPAAAAVVDLQEMRRIVREEVQSQVVPAVERAVSQAVQPMQLSIQELIQNGVSVDNDKIALTVAESVDEPLQAAIAQTIKTVLIPTLESMTGQIFAKVSHSLDQGLSAAASAAAASAAAAVASDGGGSDPKLEAISTQLSTMTALVAELTGEVQSLRATVAAQQTAVAAAAAAANQPAQQRPDTIETVKGEIIKLLSEKNYEEAFTKAVSRTTAELAVFCCAHADLTEVLGCADEIKLSQTILICLMQQLGTVVGSPSSSHSSNFQVEVDWLQDIALSLDPTDTTIQQHIPRVLQGLVTNINARLAEGGDPALRRPLQRLLSILRGIRIR